MTGPAQAPPGAVGDATPGAATAAAVPRKHILVAHIDQHLRETLVQHPRVADLPEMVLRHGVLQTAAFLRSKSIDKDGARTQDGYLLELLAGCVEKATGRALAIDELAGLDLEVYLMVNEAAIEAATWILLLVRARAALSSEKEPT